MMKKTMTYLAVILVTVVTGWAEKQTADALPLGLVPVGKVDSALVERVRDWTVKQTGLDVLVLEPLPPAKTVEAQFEALKKLPAGKTRLVVALCEKPVPDGTFLPMDKEGGIAQVSLSLLSEGDPEPEVFSRRIERGTLRGVAFLLGLEISPDPFCVTARIRALAQFDQMGRNFSPPSLLNLQRAAVAGKLRLDPDSPRLMLDIGQPRKLPKEAQP